METYELDWTTFKTTVIPRGYAMRWAATRTGFDVLALDSGIIWVSRISDSAEILDFTTNFQSSMNLKIGTQIDSDGAVMSRVKVAPAGWNYQMRMVQFTTSLLGSIVNNDADGNVLTDAVLKLYKADGSTITDPADQNLCVKTVMDLEPPHDYYIAGGHLKMNASPEQDVYCHFIGVPDVPAQYGGSKKFVQNVNLRFLHPQIGIAAGAPQAAKFLAYSATLHTNKMRVLFTHPAGFQIALGTFMEIYKA